MGATTINKVCGSGLKAAMLAAQAVRAGDADLFVAGGFESMSRAPYLVAGRSGELKFGHQSLTDALLLDGLWDPFEDWTMGMAAEFIADEYEVTREAMDRFALESHQKAVAAQEGGKFGAEIAPVQITGRKGETLTINSDEGPRKDSSIKALARLKPSFKPDGKVTPGNASSMNDGAAAVVIASQNYSEAHGLKPIARVVAYAQAAVEPKYLFAAPAHALPKLLQKQMNNDTLTIIDSAQEVTRNQCKNLGDNYITIFSFYPTKPIGSCDGGMICSDNKDIIDFFKLLTMNGAIYNNNSWDRKMILPGWKMYMNSIQCYIANENLKKLENKQNKLLEIWNQYNNKLDQQNKFSNHLYRVKVSNNEVVLRNLQEQGIQCGIHYKCCHLDDIYKNKEYQLPNSELASKTMISIPYNEKLTDANINKIIKCIRPYII